MKTNDSSAGVATEKTPFGKIMGVVENHSQLKAVSDALSKLGVQEIEVLDGVNGVNVLDSEQDSVSQCFLGDMEAESVKRYRDAVKNGLIVFAAIVDPEMAAQAGGTAKALGASELVHFGRLLITNY